MGTLKLLKTNKVVYLGNFGNKKKSVGSQIKKTQSIYSYLAENGLNLAKINTEEFKTFLAPLTLIRFLYYLLKSESIIVSLNQNGLKFSRYMFLRLINKFKGKKLIFITIGGWLPEYLLNHKTLISYLRNYDKIYVQANEIKVKLEDMDFENIENMYNFSVYDKSILKEFEHRINSINYEEKKEINLVFFAVIRREKGLEVIIEAIKTINKNLKDFQFSLDIIGPVLETYKEQFYKVIRENADICNYKGVISDQNEIFNTLNKYDALAFPTFHDGEGFPTAIVESFISGLPVVASDWKYNREIIISKKNGLLFNTNNSIDLLAQLDWLYKNKDKIKRMRINCLKEAEKYHLNVILKPLLEQLTKN